MERIQNFKSFSQVKTQLREETKNKQNETRRNESATSFANLLLKYNVASISEVTEDKIEDFMSELVDGFKSKTTNEAKWSNGNTINKNREMVAAAWIKTGIKDLNGIARLYADAMTDANFHREMSTSRAIGSASRGNIAGLKGSDIASAAGWDGYAIANGTVDFLKEISEDGAADKLYKAISKFDLNESVNLNSLEEIIEEGTRGQFGKIYKSGEIASVYTHYDSYPENMLPIIKKGYKKGTDVDVVLGKGDNSGLEVSPEKMKFYGDPDSLKPLMGTIKNLKKYINDADANGAEYAYLYDERDSKWYMIELYGDKRLVPAFESVTNEDFNDVSDKFKKELDNLSDDKFNTKDIEALIKKHKEKRPDSAMAYTKKAFGWLFKESVEVESVVTEAKSFSEREIKDAAEVVADAVAKVERTKTEVIAFKTLNKDGKIAGFYIQKATNKHGAPSRYWVTDSGEVVSAFRHDTFGNGVIAQVGDKLDSVVKTFKANESVVTEASLSGIEFGNDDDIHPTKFKPLVQSLKKNRVKMEVEKEEGMHGYPEVKLTGKRKDIEKVLADVWGPDSVSDYEDYFESVVTEASLSGIEFGNDDDIHPTKFKPLVQSLKKNRVKMEVEKEEGMHGYPEVKLTGKRKDIEKVLADVWGPDSVSDYEDYFESVVTEGEVDIHDEIGYLIEDLYAKLNDLAEDTTDSKWRKAIESIVKGIEGVESKIGQAASKLGIVPTHEAKEIEEGNAFGTARLKAIEAGEKEFEFNGKTYPVESADKEDKEAAKDMVANEAEGASITEGAKEEQAAMELYVKLVDTKTGKYTEKEMQAMSERDIEDVVDAEGFKGSEAKKMIAELVKIAKG